MTNLKHEIISQNLISVEQFPANEDIEPLAARIIKGDSIIIRNALSSGYCADIVEYLRGIRSGTIPTYKPLKNDTPNHFRINHEDKRSAVNGYFEQFNFFMHNQDIMNLFGETRHIFELKDSLSFFMAGGKMKYNSLSPPENFISRLGFQFYPVGKGYLQEHSDYVGENQLVVPTIILSKRGKDYSSGGFYYKKENQEIIDPEPYVNVGDLIVFNPRLYHGVAKIAANAPYNWRTCDGRWMAFATTTKTT